MSGTIRINPAGSTGQAYTTAAKPVRGELCSITRIPLNCKEIRSSGRELILGTGPRADFFVNDNKLAGEHLSFRFNDKGGGWDVRNLSPQPAELQPDSHPDQAFPLTSAWHPIERGDLILLPGGHEITFDLVPPAGQIMPERVLRLGNDYNKPGNGSPPRSGSATTTIRETISF